MDIVEVLDKDIEVGIDWECPICGKNPQFNAKVLVAAEECRAIRAGKIPGKWYTSLEEARKDIGF